jgi:hypothetical protein
MQHSILAVYLSLFQFSDCMLVSQLPDHELLKMFSKTLHALIKIRYILSILLYADIIIKNTTQLLVNLELIEELSKLIPNNNDFYN